MSGLLLIEAEADWEQFKLDLALKHGLESDTVKWDSSPTSYPCLSSGVIIDSCIVCVFVYVGDAERLLASYDSDTKPSLETIVPEVSQDGAWARHMVALFLAMLHEMVSVGLTKEERFESLVNEMRDRVEQKHAKDLDVIRGLIDREFKGEGG